MGDAGEPRIESTSADAQPCAIRAGYRPGVIGDVVGAHMAYYAPAWGFGLSFESKVAIELADFLQRYDPARDLLLTAAGADAEFLGSITIDGVKGHDREGAHLRWFITTPAARGTGLGRRLMQAAIDFCDVKDYAAIYLTTFAGLDAAHHLYQQAGFVLAAERSADTWSGTVGEQRFVRLRSRHGSGHGARAADADHPFPDQPATPIDRQ